MSRETITFEPRNVETPAGALREALTPAGAFYVRSHFPAPALDADKWELRLAGGLRGPAVTLAALDRMPQREVVAVLECAGNGRTRFRPIPPGTPWGDGAVACARFSGVSLRDVIREVPAGARELVFAGADEGVVEGKRVAFERSLPLDVALHPDTLLCTRMDGAPLTRDHGSPARLVVPGWYGVASVKWLVEARATAEPFSGHYQSTHYVYEPGDPVTRMRVKSMIAAPADARAGHATRVEGHAWSGEAPVARVDVSTDGGQSWREAKLGPSLGPYAWRAFSLEWTPAKSGLHVLLSRARDETGREQPWDAPWNALGYGQNGLVPHRVLVAP